MNCLYCFTVVEFILTTLNTPITKVWGAHHERSVPFRGALWGDNSRRYGAPGAVTALDSSIIFVFKWWILTCTKWNWKYHVIIVVKTDLSGFVLIMHSGLCEQYVKSLGLSASEFGFLFLPRPRTLWQQNPPELVLIPKLNISLGLLAYCEMSNDVLETLLLTCIPKFQRWDRWSLVIVSNFIPHFTGDVITYPCWD